MQKILVIITIFFTVFLSSSTAILADSPFRLISIGGKDASGIEQTPSVTWTSDTSNPVFIGEATPSSKVKLTFNGYINTVLANIDGAWSFYPTSLTTGNYATVITSGDESIAFTLAVSSLATSSAYTSDGSTVSYPSSLPSSGVFETTLVLILIGLTLLGLGLLFRKNYLDSES